MHVRSCLHGARCNHVHAECPLVDGVKGRIGDEARHALGALCMSRDQGGLVRSGKAPSHAVKCSVRSVALDAGDVFVRRAAGVSHGHAGNCPAVPEVAGGGHHVVDIVNGHTRVA